MRPRGKCVEDEKIKYHEVRAPIVGVFYDGPTCGGLYRDESKPPYVEIGSYVTPETVVCDIEAMLIIKSIESGVRGIVKEKLVTSGQPVAYDQPLFKIKPDTKKGKIKMNSLENKTKQIEPILNPNGPDKEATDELIEALSEVANSESFARDCAKNLIEAVKKGYEIQSGKKFE